MSERTAILQEINGRVNAYPYENDEITFGTEADYWERISKQGRGDCDDYAMEKRWQCLDAGIPLDDMRLAMCITEMGQYHVVLIVADEGGDWVLDNRQQSLLTLDNLKGLGYRGISLQIPGEWLWEEWVI